MCRPPIEQTGVPPGVISTSERYEAIPSPIRSSVARTSPGWMCLIRLHRDGLLASIALLMSAIPLPSCGGGEGHRLPDFARGRTGRSVRLSYSTSTDETWYHPAPQMRPSITVDQTRSEEHTSELQSRPPRLARASSPPAPAPAEAPAYRTRHRRMTPGIIRHHK